MNTFSSVKIWQANASQQSVPEERRDNAPEPGKQRWDGWTPLWAVQPSFFIPKGMVTFVPRKRTNRQTY